VADGTVTRACERQFAEHPERRRQKVARFSDQDVDRRFTVTTFSERIE
jgi:hypothetical protein